MTRLFRAFAFLALGLLLGGSASYAFAGYAQLKAPSNVGGSVGARTTSGAAAVSGGSFSAGYSVNVGGRAVTLPAVMRFAANSGQIAAIAVRGSPSVLIGTAVLAWLAQKGLNYLDGEIVKEQTLPLPEGLSTWSGSYLVGGFQGTFDDVIVAATAKIAQNNGLGNCPNGPAGTTWCPSPASLNCSGGPTNFACMGYGGGNLSFTKLSTESPVCPAGTTSNGIQCVGTAVPATSADWDAVAAQPLPDPVAEELAGKGVPLPLQSPEFDPSPKIVPLSEPYPKPNGRPGETVKDVAKVTPAPDEKVKIEVVAEPVTGPNGVPIPASNPDGSANPEAAPEEKPDFCIENPDALACWKDGKPEDVDLVKDTKNVAITPQGGWGPDTATCPQPRKHVLKNGYTVQMSWEPVCDGAGMFRPVVLGLAWLAAIYAFMAMYRKSQA